MVEINRRVAQAQIDAAQAQVDAANAQKLTAWFTLGTLIVAAVGILVGLFHK